MRPLGVLLVAMLGCTERAPTPTGLRVPLPDGWVARPAGNGLAVGPRGRAVATLESRAHPVPRAQDLARAAVAEGASGLLMDDGVAFSAVRYELAPARSGFLAVKQVGQRTVWCASTAEASADQLDDALALCRNLSVEE